MLRQGENAIEGERFPVQVLKRQVRGHSVSVGRF